MLPPGYRWREVEGPYTHGWLELLNAGGTRAALIQPHLGRFAIRVAIDGYHHEEKIGSAGTLERAKMHVERWACERA